MDTVIRKTDDVNINKEVIEEAGEILKRGGLVAFPTETVYGLGANGLDEQAAAKIYAAKGRPSDNPLIIHICEIGALDKIVANIPESGKKLAEKFWPGPLTMIFEKTPIVPLGTTGGLETVAVRMPNHKVALEIIKAGGGYIAAPSANTSGRPSPTKAEHVADDLSGRIDMIVDGGMVGIGIESTIVDVTGDIPMILRPGYITKEMLEEVVGEVTIDKAIIEGSDVKDKPKAPGMKYKHYAPKGDLTIIEGKSEDVVAEINRLAKEKEQNGKKVGIICTDETIMCYDSRNVMSIGTRENEVSISHNLYDVLRKFDDLEVEFIYSESFDEGNMGMAIMNRLLKAAGHKIIHV